MKRLKPEIDNLLAVDRFSNPINPYGTFVAPMDSFYITPPKVIHKFQFNTRASTYIIQDPPNLHKLFYINTCLNLVILSICSTFCSYWKSNPFGVLHNYSKSIVSARHKSCLGESDVKSHKVYFWCDRTVKSIISLIELPSLLVGVIDP